MPSEDTNTRAGWLVAPDSFKGTFSAPLVAQSLADGLQAAHAAPIDVCPVADGGEGTLRILVDACGGAIQQSPARDALGRTVIAEYALLEDSRTAVVETAEASGLGRVDPAERDAETASSAGTGDLIIAAARSGAERILVGVGGSACTDGGSGAIEAIREAGGLDGIEIEVLCDSLTMFESAAIVFAAQKGADLGGIVRLTDRLERIAPTFPRDPRGVPMSGCGGGLSGGLWAHFDARLRSGADAVLDAVGFDERAARVASVITGEGRLDRQSLSGKLISVVARRAIAAGALVHAVVGQSRLTREELDGLGVHGALLEATSLDALRLAGQQLARIDRVDTRAEFVRSFAQ